MGSMIVAFSLKVLSKSVNLSNYFGYDNGLSLTLIEAIIVLSSLQDVKEYELEDLHQQQYFVLEIGHQLWSVYLEGILQQF